MIKRLETILFLLSFFALECLSQNADKDDFLRDAVRQSGQARITIPFTGVRQLNYLSDKISVSSVHEKSIEIVISPLTIDWFLSQNLNYEITGRIDRKSVKTASDISQAMEWESYPSYTQYDSIMQSFRSLYPLLCDVDTIGRSINGKLILVLKISDNVAADEDETETFFTSSIHGDETAGYILMLRLADYLLKNYNSSSRVRNLVDNLEIWINPLANPDGTYRTGNTISSPTRFNANGYDLNRNFPDPVTPNTIKQKETLSMVEFLRERRFTLSANFHSGAEVVNFPWDSNWWPHADDDWFYNISRKYADTVHLYAPGGYMTFMYNGVTNGYEWYQINGGRQDFVTRELQGREVTIELHDDYVTPESQLNSLWQYNYRSLLGYLENALYGIHGYIKDRETGKPVPAKIFITGHDKDSSHIYSDTLTGRYTRMLAPGTYDLNITSKGYIGKQIDDVIVYEGQAITLNVEMVPFINPVDTTDTPGLIVYPNPSADYFTLVLPQRQFGNITLTIFNSMGMKMSEYSAESVEDIPLRIDVSALKGGIYILQVRNRSSKMTDRARIVVVRR